MDDNDFFEEDESPDQIRWAWQRGKKGRTRGTKRLSWRHRWMLWRTARRWSHHPSRLRRFARRWSPWHLRTGLTEAVLGSELGESRSEVAAHATSWLRGEMHNGLRENSLYRDHFETRPGWQELFPDDNREEPTTDP